MVLKPNRMNQPLPETNMKCIWNKSKTIPDTSSYKIELEIQSSINRDSLKDYLSEILTGMLESVKKATGADEKLISIN